MTTIVRVVNTGILVFVAKTTSAESVMVHAAKASKTMFTGPTAWGMATEMKYRFDSP